MNTRDFLNENTERIYINDIQIRMYLALALQPLGLDPQDSLTSFTGLSIHGHQAEESQRILDLSDKLEKILEPMFLFGYDNDGKLKTTMLAQNLALKLDSLKVAFNDRELETIIQNFLSYSSNFNIFNN